MGFALNIEQLDLAAPRATGVHLLLLALLRAQDEVNWEDRKQLPSALFGQLLLGVYQLPLTDRPAVDVGLERLPDSLLIKLYRLIRLARRLIDLTLAPKRLTEGAAMNLSFNVLNQAMLTQVLHELRLGNLQRCKALGLGEDDIYLLQSLPPTTLSRLAHATVPGLRSRLTHRCCIA